MSSQEAVEAKIDDATAKVSTQGAVVRELKDRVKALKKAKVHPFCTSSNTDNCLIH